jgi:hypothetical protein
MPYYSCDICGVEERRRQEYPACRECGAFVCNVCTTPNTIEESEGRNRCYCIECKDRSHYQGEVLEVDFS